MKLFVIGGKRNFQTLSWDKVSTHTLITVKSPSGVSPCTELIESTDELEKYKILILIDPYSFNKRYVYVHEDLSPVDATNILREYLLQRFIREGGE